MKVGDLIRYTMPMDKSSWIALVVSEDRCSPWIMWLDDNELEALCNYPDNIVEECFEVISASR